MKKIFGFLIILSVYYFSYYFLKILNISFPPAIFAIFVLFILLKTGLIKEEFIKDISEFLLKYMILFFIPVFVGIMNYFDIIKQNLIPLVFMVFITTFFVMISVGVFVQNAIKFKRLSNFKRGKKNA